VRCLTAGLFVFAGNALAHPGHGAPEGHVHGWGAEHILLIAVIFALLVFALRK